MDARAIVKITLVYTLVMGKSDPTAPDPSYYEQYTARFLNTYRQHPAGCDHSLHLCCCGGPISNTMLDWFGADSDECSEYFGGGWDNGAYQYASKLLNCDLAVFMAAPVYFFRDNWLRPIADAYGEFGRGLYGPQCSYENAPHVRTSCFACPPDLLSEYPHTIDTRDKCCRFEHRPDAWNFTHWVLDKGLPVKMVLPAGRYDLPDWRKPENIFRRGDQRNLLTWDRHNDIYREADGVVKAQLEARADGR